MDDEAAYRADDLAESILIGLRREPVVVQHEILARLLAELSADAALARREDLAPLIVARSREFAETRLRTALDLARMKEVDLLDRNTLSGILDRLTGSGRPKKS